MKQPFTIDAKDYDPSWQKSYRPSVRGIIISNDNLISLIYSQKYHFYKLPGGGIEEGESHLETLIREVDEETGLTVIPDSVQEFGEALRIQKSSTLKDTIFVQQNFYYICQTTGQIHSQHLDQDEQEADFILKTVSLDEAIATNQAFIASCQGTPTECKVEMVVRECRILELLRDNQSAPQTTSTPNK